MNKDEVLVRLQEWTGLTCWICDNNDVIYANLIADPDTYIPIAVMGGEDFKVLTHDLKIALEEKEE